MPANQSGDDDERPESLPKHVRERIQGIPLLSNYEVNPIPIYEQVLHGRLILLEFEEHPSAQFAVSEVMFRQMVERLQAALENDPSWYHD